MIKIQYNPWNNVCGDLHLWSFSSMKNVKNVHLKISKQIAIMASRYEVCGNLLLWSFSCMKNVKSVHLKISKQIAIMASRYEVCGNLLMWSFSLMKNVKCFNFKNEQNPVGKKGQIQMWKGLKRENNHECTTCGKCRAEYQCQKSLKWACHDHIYMHWMKLLCLNFSELPINFQISEIRKLQSIFKIAKTEDSFTEGKCTLSWKLVCNTLVDSKCR